jgi:hypothetical protein
MTQADGTAGAEGILDSPALYLGQLGSREESDKVVQVKGRVGNHSFKQHLEMNKHDHDNDTVATETKLLKKAWRS